MPAQLPTGVSEAEFTRVFKMSESYAKRRAKGMGDEASEAAHDAAVDGLMWATQNYDQARANPDRDDPFTGFALRAVARFVWRGIDNHVKKHKRKPQHVALVDDEGESIDVADHRQPGGSEIPLPDSVQSLHPDLRDAVTLFYVHGFTQRECALLCGCSLDTFQSRLKRAAEAIGRDLRQPDREPGERRLVR